MKRIAFLSLLLGATGLLSCKEDVQQPDCKAPQLVTAKSTCINSMEGITLQASDYGVPAEPLQFTWNVYILKDTAKTANLNDARKEKIVSTDALVIPLSMVQADGKVVVQVEANCVGKAMASPYFSFVKRLATPTCYKWETQKL
ncbi:MAG: hypothetical protein U0X91_01255 [Spirosomataceae bacterium]